jgi:hypothetical protein
MKTAFCHTLGIEHPIVAAPMGPDLGVTSRPTATGYGSGKWN